MHSIGSNLVSVFLFLFPFSKSFDTFETVSLLVFIQGIVQCHLKHGCLSVNQTEDLIYPTMIRSHVGWMDRCNLIELYSSESDTNPISRSFLNTALQLIRPKTMTGMHGSI